MLEQAGKLFSGETGGLTNQPTVENKIIYRVKSLWAENFRGIPSFWVKNSQGTTWSKSNLNTDADVVLITGPNGFGKTSIIDALCLLLTGYCYPDRRPLVTTFEDGQKREYALIKADVNFNDSGKHSGPVVVKIKNEDGAVPEITGFAWPPDIPGEIMARYGFYYQDLLNRLFDEDEAEVTLRDFLALPPEEVREAGKAIEKALKDIIGKEKNLFIFQGISSEEDIKNRRSQAVKKFSEAWAKLSSIVNSIGINFPQRSEGWLFVIRSGNLRSGWQGELRNLANELLAAFPAENIEPLPENTEPQYSLQRLEMLLQNVRLSMASKLENKKKLLMLVNALPEQTVIPEEEILEQEEQKLNEYKKEIDSLNQELRVLEGLERHFQNPRGPGLLEVLVAIKECGREWLNPPVDDLKGLEPPPGILQWLEHALKLFYAGGKGLDEHLAGWQEKIRARRVQTRDFTSEKEQLYKTKSNSLDIIKKIHGLAAGSVEIQSTLEDVRQKNGGLISRDSLVAFLEGGDSEQNTLSDEPEKILASVREAVLKWLEVERSERQREETLRKTRGYDDARVSLDAVREALRAESNKRTSIIEKILDLPEKEKDQLAGLVNQVHASFRTVKGLIPIRFESVSRRRGRAQVNTWNVSTDDGRPLGALSTGQKSQLGLSLLISLNFALSHLIPYKIIALDDVTTALDMAQLPRIAALLRQVAYGSGFEDSPSRRQLFIVSHHEDLTHRIIDFLIPPEGRSMHILNIVEWSPESGPKIEQLKVEPASSVNDTVKSRFIRLLCSGIRTD
ncbi:MAG: AAA family ATPase [Syntrophothermus sp.]|uniref:AAA family ATPase n=1 Tax=Syntrophothermus sp. TaxID=2736299 RepID=UPI00257A16A9|nr:AAA family ATPase [Syntrophothermus sp.]NSW84193.1 AAA family ATPase [Syntrophothermus sp.]